MRVWQSQTQVRYATGKSFPELRSAGVQAFGVEARPRRFSRQVDAVFPHARREPPQREAERAVVESQGAWPEPQAGRAALQCRFVLSAGDPLREHRSFRPDETPPLTRGCRRK